MSDDVQNFLAGYSPAVCEIALQLRETILKTVPNADEKVYQGWNSIGYSYGGGMKAQFCAIGPLKDRVNLYFNRGAALADPAELLEGTGKNMRHVKVRTTKEAQTKALKSLIKAAAALHKSEAS